MRKTALIIVSLTLLSTMAVDAATERGETTTSERMESSSPYPDGEQILEYEESPLFHYTEGIRFSRVNKEIDTATEHFKRAIEMDSLHAPSYYELAYIYMFKSPPVALEYSKKANSIDQTDYWYAAQLGKLYIVMGEYKQAQGMLERIIELNPKVPENYTMLAALYEQTEQPFSAIATLERGESLLGRLEMFLDYKTELFIKMSLFDKAVTEGELLVENHPYSYENHLKLAQIYAEVKRDSLAKESFAEALRLNPEGLDVLHKLREFYGNRGDNVEYIATTKRLIQSDQISLDEKVEMYNKLTKNREFYGANYFQIKDLASTLYLKYPEEYVTLEIYADNMAAWGAVEQGVELYKKYIAYSDPEKVTIEPYQRVIGTEAYLKNYGEVEKYLKMADRRFPRNAELHLMSGWAISRIEGREKEAEKAYLTAYKYATHDSVKSAIMGAIGDMYHQQKREKKAFATYEKALKLWGENIHVLNNYAYYLVEKNEKLDVALKMAAKVMELEPTNATYMDTYGWILYKLGLYEEAKKAMQQAVALDTESSKVLLMHYGDILYKLGDHYMATVYWRRAAVAGYDSEEVANRLKLPQIKVEEKIDNKEGDKE